MTISLSGCFTGVESTKAITQKDVNKVLEKDKSIADDTGMSIYKLRPSSFSEWETGRTFYVTDDNIKLLFRSSSTIEDSVSLKDKFLTYQRYSTETSITGAEVINIVFTDNQKHIFVYPTNRTLQQLNDDAKVAIPYLIDMNKVMELRSMLIGKELYIRTSLWYDANGNMIKGRKFVKTTIEDVMPGNKYFPYMIKFRDDKTEAYIFLSSEQSSVQNRSLNDLFSLSDIHDKYPTISNENWELIINGDLALDMTKDECRLSMGSPKTIDRTPTYDGLKEYWTYDNGIYLIFEDGLLRKFRK